MPRTARSASRAWIVVGMLSLFMLINFADEFVLGLSAVPIMRELKLNHVQFGLIGSSFFTFFSFSTVLAGFLVNRVPAKFVLLGMAFIWIRPNMPKTRRQCRQGCGFRRRNRSDIAARHDPAIATRNGNAGKDAEDVVADHGIAAGELDILK